VHDVGEAGVLDPAFEFDARAGFAVEIVCGINPKLVPFSEVGVV